MRTALGVWVLAFWPGWAGAQDLRQDLREAERHFEQGRVLYEAGNYAAALPELERAYQQMAGDPQRFLVLHSLGQTYEALFQYDRAIECYERYLAEGGEDAPARADVQAQLRALRGLLGSVRIETNVPRAEVWLDGRRIGEAPGELRIPGGRHSLEIRAPMRLPVRREISLAARETLSLRLVLERPSQGLSPVWFWVATGAAVVPLGLGVVFGIEAIDASDDAQAHATGGTWDEAERVRDLALTADIFFGITALVATGAAILAFLTDWD